MNANRTFFYLLLLLQCCNPVSALAAEPAQNCVICHADRKQGFSSAHHGFAQACTICHSGNAKGTTKVDAHRGLIAFPGDLDTVVRACGGCHKDKVESVTHGLMNTGIGVIASTRKALGETENIDGHADFAHLGHSPADSMLRKQCASCHLGQHKSAHRLDSTLDRGGGCLACHINAYPSDAHPALTAKVSDARCFGCHSRSGRISLNYVGLAETDTITASTKQLADRRWVETRPDDRHHAAGMGCIDCHTENDLMAVGADHSIKRAHRAVDIACTDCHAIKRTISQVQWPKIYRNLLSRIPFHNDRGTRFPVTARGTPLWNIELRGADAWLHRKDGQGVLRIPAYRASDHLLAAQHARLSCSACHSQWVPQCYGCHMDYDPGHPQFDHIDGRNTPGTWNSQRSDVRNTLPPLGVDADNRIVPVLPGMIMTIRHPDWSSPLFRRQFQAIEPHTTGASRSCASCHNSSTALGLGEGTLKRQANGKLLFQSAHARLEDGLAGDAWTRLDADPTANKNTGGLRPFGGPEMTRILSVPLPGGNGR